MVVNRANVAKSFHHSDAKSAASSFDFKPQKTTTTSSQTAEAIKNILDQTLPDTINNIHIKYDLREAQSLVYHDQKDYILTIMPVEIECENVAVSLRISPYTLPFDFDKTSLAYKYLQKEVGEALMTYIRNLNKKAKE